MKKKNIEKKINKIISTNVPDVLDEILIKCEEKRGFNLKNEEVKETKTIFTPRLIGGLCTILIVALIGLFGINKYNNLSVSSIIEFDVNPSIELLINKKEKVIKANSLNEDAKVVLKDMDLKNVELNVAVNAIIGSMIKNGYLSIDKNSILISVNNKNNKESERLQKELTDEINRIFKSSQIEGSILTQKLDNNSNSVAEKYNISEGKSILINNILATNIKNTKGELYTFEDLAPLSINELKLLLEDKGILVDNVYSSGSASTSNYIGKDKAKDIALKNAKLTEDKIKKYEIEFDVENGIFVYEIDFEDNKGYEYEYEINSKTGEIIFKELNIDHDLIDDFINDQASNNQTSQENNINYITKEKAKEIAFKNAGVAANNVYELKVELDKDDGIYVYEVEFKSNKKVYSYEINAITGKILDKDIERDDD